MNQRSKSAFQLERRTDQITCKVCHAKNAIERERCRNCGYPLRETRSPLQMANLYRRVAILEMQNKKLMVALAKHIQTDGTKEVN